MLQRQVYRGGPPPPSGGNAAANAEIRMDQLETQMRELTGRVEEVMNQVEQVRQRIEQINSDLGVRTAQTPAGPGPVASPPRRPGGRARPSPPLAAGCLPAGRGRWRRRTRMTGRAAARRGDAAGRTHRRAARLVPWAARRRFSAR